jgi:squalene-hopene/tetraprenyl-beta-curcumene cyclase
LPRESPNDLEIAEVQGHRALLMASASPRSSTDPSTPLDARTLRTAIERSAQQVKSTQARDAFWYAEMEGNISLTTEMVLLYRALGLRRPEQEAGFRRYLCAAQRPDGTFALHADGPPDLSLTVEGYWGLKLLGEPIDSERMVEARAFIHARGGAQRARVLTLIYLAMFGQLPYDRLPYLPPELMLLPAWSRLSIYELAIWARGLIVPFFMIRAEETVFPLGSEGQIAELFSRGEEGEVAPHRVEPRGPVAPLLRGMEGATRLLDRLPPSWCRSRALAEAEQWVLEHQEPEGSWYTYPPIWMSILALFARGHRVDSDPIRRGVAYLESLHWKKGEELRQQATESSIWDTILAAQALIEAGHGAGPEARRAARLILSLQRRVRGDWRVKAGEEVAAGGWTFEQANRIHPDLDSTAEAILLLRQVDWGSDVQSARAAQAAIALGRDWIWGMQNRDGSWGTYEKDNTSPIFCRIAFDDMDVFTDPRWPDTTGRQLTTLGLLGVDPDDRRVKAALRYLRRSQEKDGSFFGRWGTCYLLGTYWVLRGAGTVGVSWEEPWLQEGLAFLEAAQNRDGGFGESNDALSKGRYVPLGRSIPSQTAWGLLGLLCRPGPPSLAADRAAAWLLANQNPDGAWSETAFTGGGLKASWYLRYSMYPVYFPTLALTAYLRRRARREGASSGTPR